MGTIIMKRFIPILVGLLLPFAASAFQDNYYDTNLQATVDAHVQALVSGPTNGITLLAATNVANASALAATNNLKYQPPSTTLTNLSGITTNQIVFTNNTVWFDTNGSATAATKLATNGILGAAYQSVSYFDLAGAGTTAATAATNGMGKTTGLAAFQNTNFFDLAGAGTAAALAATNGLAPTNYVNSTLVTVYITNFAIPTYRTNYTVSLAGLGVTTNLLIREDLYLVPQSSNPLFLEMTSGTLLNSKGIGGADNAGCPPFAQTTSDGGLTWSVIYTGETHISFADTNGSPTTVSPIQAAANFKLQSRYSWVKHQ